MPSIILEEKNSQDYQTKHNKIKRLVKFSRHHLVDQIFHMHTKTEQKMTEQSEQTYANKTVCNVTQS